MVYGYEIVKHCTLTPSCKLTMKNSEAKLSSKARNFTSQEMREREKNSFISEKKNRESRVTTYLFGDFLVENHLEFR